MATYRKILKDYEGNNIIPLGVDNVNIEVTDEDPGEGATLPSNHFVAVYGSIVDALYPVGSIYMSATLSTAEQVEDALGGTWEAWGAGRVPVGVDATQTEFNTVNKTGGEKIHILTTAEMPSHTHVQNSHWHRVGSKRASGDAPQVVGWYGSGGGSSSPYWQSGGASNSSLDTYGVIASGATATNQNTGGGGSHNNLQPYITCYMYKRTA